MAARRLLKKAVRRSVRRESLNVKGFEGRAFGSPTFHYSRVRIFVYWRTFSAAD